MATTEGTKEKQMHQRLEGQLLELLITAKACVHYAIKTGNERNAYKALRDSYLTGKFVNPEGNR